MTRTTESVPNQPITYFGIAYRLTKQDLDRIAPVKDDLQKQYGRHLLFPQEASYHVTILNISPVVERAYDERSLTLFENKRSSIIEMLKRVAISTAPFEIRLQKIEAYDRAVIIRGRDKGEMAAMRTRLRALQWPGAGQAEPGFIHTTLARYDVPLELDEVQRSVKKVKVDIPVMIDKISLVRMDETSRTPEVLGEYSLKA